MSRVKALDLLLILLLIVALNGCSHVSPKSITDPIDSPKPVAVLPRPSGPTITSNRVITIQALDNEYQGCTAVQPDNRLDHQKGSHD